MFANIGPHIVRIVLWDAQSVCMETTAATKISVRKHETTCSVRATYICDQFVKIKCCCKSGLPYDNGANEQRNC